MFTSHTPTSKPFWYTVIGLYGVALAALWWFVIVPFLINKF